MTVQDEKVHRESAVAIRSKNRFWRAAMRREGGGDENIFIAKIRDSESVRRAFARRRSLAMTSTRRRLHSGECRKGLRYGRFQRYRRMHAPVFRASSHRFVNVLPCYRQQRVARSRIVASTLP
jgi:hypothetical protein